MPLFVQADRPVENAISFPAEFIKLDSLDTSRLLFTLFFDFDTIQTIAKRRQRVRVQVLSDTRTEVISGTGDVLGEDIEKRAIALNSTQTTTKLYDQLCEQQVVDLTSFVDTTSVAAKSINTIAYSKVDLTSSIEKVAPSTSSQLASFVDTSRLRDSRDARVSNQGIFRKSNDLSPSEAFYKKRLESSTTSVTSNESIGSAYVPVPTTDVTSFIRASSKFSIPTSSPDIVWIYIDLIDQEGTTVQTIQQNITLSSLVDQHYVRETPQVKITRSSRVDDGKFNVIVDKRKDRSATLYFDNGNSTSALEVPQSGMMALVDTGRPASVKVVYQDETFKGYEFSSSVVTPRRSSYYSTAGFVKARQTRDSVVLKAYDVPLDAAAVIFYVSNKTLRTPPQVLSSVAARVDENAYVPTAVHSNLIVGTIYEYHYVSFMKDGTSRKSKSDVVEFYEPFSGGFDTTISNLNVDVPGNEVSFSLSTSLNMKQVDSLYELFKSRGLESYVSEYIEKGLTETRDLFSYFVVRFDLTTGTKENLGHLVSGSFVDSRQSTLTKASPLRGDRIYSYEVYTTLTDPTTAFDSQKQEIKTFAGPVVIDNQKFKHIASLKNSMLLSPAGLRTKFSKSILEFGALGSPLVVDADFRQNQERQLNVVATPSFSSRKNVIISWDQAPDLANGRRVDHYIVSRTTAFDSRILGRCAPIPRPVFVDNLDVTGEVVYLITPVYNDLSIGPSSSTKIEVSP